MANYYKIPPLGSPVVDSAGVITQAWATLLREFQTGLNAELASGRVQPFWLSAADLADPTKFMQAGASVGKGVGEYLGWAKCDGNDSRPNPGDTFLRFSLTDSAGTTGGTDTDGAGTTGSTAISVAQMPPHKHGAKKAAAAGGDGSGLAWSSTTATNDSHGVDVGGGLGHEHTISEHDNRPAFSSWVPLIRIPVMVTP